jgi:hypothetical protein
LRGSNFGFVARANGRELRYRLRDKAEGSARFAGPLIRSILPALARAIEIETRG